MCIVCVIARMFWCCLRLRERAYLWVFMMSDCKVTFLSHSMDNSIIVVSLKKRDAHYAYYHTVAHTIRAHHRRTLGTLTRKMQHRPNELNNTYVQDHDAVWRCTLKEHIIYNYFVSLLQSYWFRNLIHFLYLCRHLSYISTYEGVAMRWTGITYNRIVQSRW